MVINDIQIPYPELRIVAQPKLHYSVENAKIGLTLNRIYERFDAICHFHYVSERFFFSLSNFKFNFKMMGVYFQPLGDNSLGDISEFSDSAPDYWIGKWFLEYVDGFVYQISDKSVGMLFNDGLKFMRTPEKEYVIFLLSYAFAYKLMCSNCV